MPPLLLQTKLYIPPTRPGLVSRPRLIERLNAGLPGRNRGFARKLTLVCAPAGYGKTTLVSAWLRSVDQPHAWISLDEGDNDLVCFLNYLVTAFRQVDGEIGQAVQHLLETPQLPSVEALLTELINDILTRSSSLVLVLDDYHTITESSVHEAVGFLLERQPPQMHMVVVSRQDPPLPLSRLRGRGQITEIRQSDLRFTLQEATAFLNQSMGLKLETSQVATLDTHTEGWITGLHMAALALQSRRTDGGTEGVARFIDSFSGRHHFVLDYLTDEVLRHQPEPIYKFLLRTCILERMCGSLCDALVNEVAQDNGTFLSNQQILEYLQQANLFVMPLDDERRWYRYHRLFAELLRARLQETDPDQVAGLHLRAATWYDRNTLPAEAIHHALAVPDFDLAAEVIERAILKIPTWSSISTATFMGWMAVLPDEVVHVRPWLRLFASRVLYLTGQRAAARHALRKLEDSLREDPTLPDAEQILRLAVSDRASYAAVRGDVQQAIQFARQVLAQLPQDDAGTRIRVTSILGLSSLRAGDVKDAERAFSEAIATAQAAGLKFAAVPLICNLADVQFVQGQLRLAIQNCEQAIQLGTVDGTPIQPVGFAHLELGKILYEQNDLPAAEQHLLKGLKLLQKGQITIGLETGYAILAQIRQAQGNAAGALAAIDQAMQITQGNDIARLSTLTSAYQARIWLAQDRLDLAARWAYDYWHNDQVEYLREFEDLTLARVLLARGESTKALALLDRLLASAEAAGRLGGVIEAQALRALAQQATGDSDGALETLSCALEMAEPEGYVRVFVDAGQPMAELLRRASARGLGGKYVNKLLGARQPSSPRPTRSGFAHPTLQQTALIEPLTDREIEVLLCLAEGLSNAETAQRLFISLPTVKSHTRNIYGKLGVHSRKEAVTQARELGILSS
jgi:LuxR family maltose regulon positive regulatory protein